MGFLDKAADYMNKEYEKGVKGVNQNLARKLKDAPDSVVLQKLDMAEGGPAYDTVYQEARRRGLV